MGAVRDGVRAGLRFGPTSTKESWGLYVQVKCSSRLRSSPSQTLRV